MMRYGRNQRDETRTRILDVASRMFRERGVAATGVAGLMEAAGLTNGAFYAHFPSKEALVADAVTDQPGRRPGRFAELLSSGASPEHWIPLYLSPEHRDDPGGGCPVASLAAELARHPEPTRARFAEAVERTVALMAVHMPGHDEADRLNRAYALYGTLLGTLQLARIAGRGPASDAILAGGIRAALAGCAAAGA
ncbi:MAG: TetR family transcriptional regulator [Gluconacetobacter diazotrophicus]|nr:TetR family transcriptional regulator [Gluconacetobacter diazotrophicus]